MGLEMNAIGMKYACMFMSYNLCYIEPFEDIQMPNNVDSNEMLDLIKTLIVNNRDENLNTWKIILMLFIDPNQEQIIKNKQQKVLNEINVLRNPFLKTDTIKFNTDRSKNILKQKFLFDSDDYDNSYETDDELVKRSKGKSDKHDAKATIVNKNRNGLLRLIKCEEVREICIKACKEAYKETCSLLSVSSHSDIKMSYEGENAKKYYNDILKSLVGLNENRVRHLKRLYTLNNYNFGKGSLRNFIENAKGYNDLKKSINVILKGINNIAKDDPNSALNSHRTYALNIRNDNRDNLNLKQKDTSYEDIIETRKDEDEQDNISENIMSITDGNIINALRYYFFILELNCLNQYGNLNNIVWLKKLLKPQNKVTAKLFVLNNLKNGKGFYVTLDDEITLNTDREESNDVIDNTDTIDKSLFFRNNNELSVNESEEVKSSADIQTTEIKDSSVDDSVHKVNLRGSRGREKCIRACKDVYWGLCDYFRCERSFRRRIKRSCERACRKRF
nr:uncharacterized protein LOC113392081 [Vanessa tameamea]